MLTYLETALRHPGADLSRERVHRRRAELLEAGRHHPGRMAWQAGRGVWPVGSRRSGGVRPSLRRPAPGRPANSWSRIAPSMNTRTQTGGLVSPVEHRAGWDATFSAPKSVSLTALVGGDDRGARGAPRGRQLSP